jgi:NlpC/P60 family
MSIADEAIKVALAQVGKPYKWAAAGPDRFDCSGLIIYAFAKAGKPGLPHFSGSLIRMGQHINNKADLLAGDLVSPHPGHIQLYIGGGKIVEAPRTGLNVRVVPLGAFWRGARIVDPATGTDFSNVDSTADVGFPNPLDLAGKTWAAITGLYNIIREIGERLVWISQPANWVRMAYFALGVILIGLGLLGLKPVQKAIASGKQAGKQVGKVVENASPA